MKLTKQNLMRLSNERLAKILVEMMKELQITHIPAPFEPLCLNGGECTNPFRDCINCPRQSTISINTTTGTSTSKEEGK